MFTIPDKDEGLNKLQSVWFQEYIDILVAGVSSNDAVISGCAVSPSANMTLAVAAGSVNSAGVGYNVAAANPVIGAADATYARLDFVVVTSAGAVAVRAGTAALNPKPPAKTAGDVVLAVVYVPALSTTVGANQIVDMKVGVSSKLAAIVNGSMGAFGHRNKIINGNFDIWQYGISQTISGYGSDDRWHNQTAGSTAIHSRQTFTLGQTDVPGNSQFFSRTSVTSVAGAGNVALKRQRIEGVKTFAGETVTLSFYAKADAAKNIAIEFVQHFGTGGTPSATVDSIGSQLIALTTAWQKFTITVALPSISGKTLGTAGNNYVESNFWFDAGSTFAARAASLGQQSGTFDIAQVQFEAGSIATPFEHRPIGTEWALCQRYCEKTFDIEVAPANAVGTNTGESSFPAFEAGAVTQRPQRIFFRVPKRAAPTVTLYNPDAANSEIRNQSVPADFTSSIAANITTTGFRFQGVSPTGTVVNHTCSAHWVAVSEL
jgi:hypothetical protein